MKLAVLSAFLLLTACSRGTPTATSTVVEPEEVGTPTRAQQGFANDAASETKLTSMIEGVQVPNAVIASAKSIGHTSVVFKVTLANGEVAAFKPPSKRGKNRYRGEVAAHRLAGLLGLSNVPEAKLVKLNRASLRSVLDEAGRQMLDDETSGESLVGAWIPWIKGLQFLHIDEPNSKDRAKVFKFLRNNEHTDADAESLALQVSTMMVFDLLTANWDRFSGANIGWDAQEKRVLFVDNDGGFFEPVNAKLFPRDRAELEKIRLFSKSFVSRLRSVSESEWTQALALGDELLTPAQIKSSWDRRTLVLGHIARVEAKYEGALVAQ